MNFQIGDLIITKDIRNNRRVTTYVIKVHEAGDDEDGTRWHSDSITIQYSEDNWARFPVTTIESMLNLPSKVARWYHYPVVK